MANMKLEIDGKVYDFVPESFAIDNEGKYYFEVEAGEKGTF